MVSRDEVQQLQALPCVAKHLGGSKCPGNSNSNTIVLIAIAGRESEDLTVNQSGNAFDLVSTVNLRNTFLGRFTSLVVRLWNIFRKAINYILNQTHSYVR